MQKVSISQAELNNAEGKFSEYMHYVVQRLSAKKTNPQLALFDAVTLIQADGLTIALGSFKNIAAENVSRWLNDYYGTRQNVSYCLPSVAYELNGGCYLLRMPILRPSKIPLNEAVIDLTPMMANSISSKQMKLLAETYNEFYNALHVIARLDTATIIHLDTAARYLTERSALYAQARWESLQFVEKAMKEVMREKGVEFKSADGHDIKGALHSVWVNAGYPALPSELLFDAWCSPSIRYEMTPQPIDLTLRAHYASIRLGALIADCLPDVEPMVDEMSIPARDMNRDPILSVIRALAAIDRSPSPPIKLQR